MDEGARLDATEKDVEHLLGRVRAAEDDLADLHARLTELENAHAARLASVESTVGGMALTLDGEMEGLMRDVQALTASVGVVRADVTALQAHEAGRVLLARLEALSDERNAARRSQMEVAAERDALRRERDAARECVARVANALAVAWTELDALKAERGTLAQMLATPQILGAVGELQQVARDAQRIAHEAKQEATLYRAVVTRVRSGDLVRCLTCEGRGHCADCEDERGEPRYGVSGLVPPDANAPLSADIDLTPEEMKP